MRCDARRGRTTIDGIAWPSHSCRRVSGQPKWPIGRYLRCVTRSAAAATTQTQAQAELQCYAPTIRRVMHTHPMLVINTYLKFAFGCQCECECVSGSAGNPICGCECYANKWNECELRNDATYLQWITHRVSVVNKPIWCCVCTWRMLNIWTRARKSPKKNK